MHLLDGGPSSGAVLLWNGVANFGDLAIIAPAAAAVVLMLVAQRRRREAIAWLASFGLCVLAISALKVRIGDFDVEIGGGLRIGGAAFPSGHTGVATAFYGGLAVLTWRARTGAADAGRIALAAVAAMLVALAALIGAAVWILAWHFAIDIAGGALIGGACSALFAATSGAGAGREMSERPAGGSVRRTAMLLCVAALVVVGLHGTRFDDTALGRDFRLRIAGR
jgi:membrane-associated phospholipid phosphatase